MKSYSKKVKGLGLCSGGLDSTLAAMILKAQGVQVFLISFETPFFSANKARKAAEKIQVPLTVINITDRYLPTLENPPGGYGKNMNPCMDCHALMFNIAGGIMVEKGYDFLFSGEVVGQRPKSQNKNSLRYVEKRSGFDGFILRPLSAKLLPETPMEKNGLVDRERLYGFSGRSRNPQMELAKQFGIVDYPSPAGGCLLTERVFSVRLKDLFDNNKNYSMQELELLKYGRHLRLDNQTKIVIGRNKTDNEHIESCYRPENDILIKMKDIPGPIVLIPNGCAKKKIYQAASIGAGYSKAPKDSTIEVCVTLPTDAMILKVNAVSKAEVKKFLIPQQKP